MSPLHVRLRPLACFLACFLLAPSGVAAEVQPASDSEVLKAVAGLVISDANVSVRGTPLAKRSPAAAKPFSRQQAHAVGIDVMTILEPAEFSAPLWNGRGLASGDIDRDGYLDILVATKKGPRLFINQAGLRFAEREVGIPALSELELHVVALVDIDNDGWLDLYLTTYQKGIYYVLSDHGKFGPDALIKAPEHPTALAQATSFGDVDEDGDLDAAIGNYYLGWSKHIPPEDSTNKILFNDKGKFVRVLALEEAIVGDTQSILLSDFNHDGHLDLIVGNDFEPPDFFYTGDGKGGFRLIKRSDQVIPISTYTTMSVDTADYNNDLRLDIWMAQIAAAGTGASARIRTRPLHRYCEDLSRPPDRKLCETAVAQKKLFRFSAKQRPSDILKCKSIENTEQRTQCVAMMTYLVVVRSGDQTLCDRMPKSQLRARFLCAAFFKPSKPGSRKQYAESIKALMNENSLLRATGDGRFENVAPAAGVETTGFSWNAKFADFDNDGWQDMYVVNGSWSKRAGTPQKFFYRNLGGKRFVERADEFGLQNFMLQSAYLTVDVDNDGDLDVLANTISGPIWFYRNNDTTNNSILFELRDHQANRYCIGCKLRIYHGPETGLAQLREIKSGGGYISFDAAYAHFGLASETQIARVEVDWSTGGTTTLQGPFPANARYRITRE